MHPLKAKQIGGIWGTVLLPIRPDDQIDFGRLAMELDYLLESGLNGIYTNGTAGEFHLQSEDEFDRISALTVERCRAAAMPFQLGASHPDPVISYQRIRRAAAMRPGAIQVILPDWWPVSNVEAVRALSRFAEAAGSVPLVLYNPPHAKRVLEPEDIAEIVEAVPAVVGIKVLGGDPAWYARMQPLVGRVSIHVAGHAVAAGLAYGASGAYSNVACLHPRGAVRLWKLMQRDLSEAIAVEDRIRRFITESIRPLAEKHRLSNMALDKLLGAVGNWSDVGVRLRSPYVGAPEECVAPLRRTAEERIGGAFFED